MPKKILSVFEKLKLKDNSNSFDYLYGHFDGSTTDRPLKQSQINNIIANIICRLLAGGGFNTQNTIGCFQRSLLELTRDEDFPEPLRSLFNNTYTTLGLFKEHTSMNNVLGRLNGAVNDISVSSGLINKCASNYIPNTINNALNNIMRSFLGDGDEALAGLGVISDIFSCRYKEGSLLKEIKDNKENIKNNKEEIDKISKRLNDVECKLKKLMYDEENSSIIQEWGGSLGESASDPYLGVGTSFDSTNIGDYISAAHNIKSLNEQLKGYTVTKNNGEEVDNVMKLFLTQDMLDLLENEQDISSENYNIIPIKNYCGDIIGYRQESNKQHNTEGCPPSEPKSFIIDKNDENINNQIIISKNGSMDTYESGLDIENGLNIFDVNYIGRYIDSTSNNNGYYDMAFSQEISIRNSKINFTISNNSYLPDGVTLDDITINPVNTNNKLNIEIGLNSSVLPNNDDIISWDIKVTKRI